MDQKIKTNKTLKTPYDKYKNLQVWDVIQKAIDDLVNNQDINETTHRDYIVGYIIKSLDNKKLL